MDVVLVVDKFTTMNYNYYVDRPFMGVNFNDTEEEVLQKLGCPDIKEEYEYNDDERSVTYYYDNETLKVIFYYNYGSYKHLSFYVQSFVVDKINVFKLSKHEVLRIIDKICEKYGQNILHKSSVEENILHDYYSYKDIGISLWFENDKLDDICIGPVIH